MMIKRFSAGMFFVIFLAFVLSGSIAAQRQSEKLAKSDDLLKLKVDKKKRLPITLKAKNVPVSRITKELSNHFKISFGLSGFVSNYKPALDLPPSSLETVLKKLAPFVILEKELTGRSARPVIKKAFLFAYNENIPVIVENVKRDQLLIFEGNTDITEDSENSDKLTIFVKFRGEKLTLRCRNQPVVAVAGRLAEEMKIPFSVGRTSNPAVTADVRESSLPAAFIHLPAEIKLRYLEDVNTGQIKYTEMILEND